MIITLGRKDIEKARSFAKNISVHKHKESLFLGHFTGKLGEIAVQKFFNHYGINVTLDFNIYDTGHWDNNDIHFHGWDIDVKCFHDTSSTFYIDFNKLNFREKDAQLPHYFVITRHADVFDINNLPLKINIEVCGYFDVRNFWKDEDNITIVHTGDVLPGTHKRAKGEYYVVRMDALKNDWNTWIQKMKAEKTSFTDSITTRTVHEERSILKLPYSILLSGSETKRATKENLHDWIMHGTKVLLFLPQNAQRKYQDLQDTYGESGLFSAYFCSDNKTITSLYIEDGNIQDERGFDTLCSEFPVFNAEQYRVEHAAVNQSLLIKASAGTGKTTVMIDRILFLLATVPNLKPEDVTMITFTNDAANHMREEIEKKLSQRYQVTKKQKYLIWMEELADMQISTIDSFFKDIVSTVGTELGYGGSVSVRSFTYEKHRIIRDVIDELFRDTEGDDGYLEQFILPIQEYRKLAETCWNKLSSRGYHQSDFKNIDFGEGTDSKSTIINTYLKKIIVLASERYDAMRVQKNAFSLGDFSSDMDRLRKATEMLRGKLNIKFLFVDEFQDTDNGQIKTLVWLKKSLGCNLFVVGDIKQSIYRFRGAEETAFDKLQEELPDQVVEYELIKNYRTAPEIIKPLNTLFSHWAGNNWLKWNSDAISGKPEFHSHPGTVEIKPYRFEWKCGENKALKNKFIQTVSGINGHICVLSRKNKQVSEIAKWCREAKIPCIAKTDGGFYQTQAVRDVMYLLGAVLYSADLRYMFSYLMSSYSVVRPEPKKLEEYSGNEMALSRYFMQLAERNGWSGIKSDSRKVPFFPWLREIIDRVQPEKIYACIQRRNLERQGYDSTEALEEQLHYDVKTYALNLSKLIAVLYQSFAGDFASILSVYTFLLRKIQTDAKEDIVFPQPENDDKQLVECMTVHKAKGLERETIMIVHTAEPYIYDLDESKIDKLKHDYTEFLIYGDSKPKLGWRYIKRQYGKVYKNDLYSEAEIKEEDEAIEREEARILYVAMTRAKQHLYLFIPYQSTDIPTWSKMIRMIQL